jgi:hypothetical protein
MKTNYQAIAIAGLNLLAIGVPNQAVVHSVSATQMRMAEASHLEISNMCKWGHAAFDPVKVDSEVLSERVKTLYTQMAFV